MASYQYYQSGGPWQNAWGTNAYQFQSPPVPTYMPQPSWRGSDYYRAHAGVQDNTLFDYVWSKVNRPEDYLGSYDGYPEDNYPEQVRSFVSGSGASRGEAEHWHRRVYSGVVQLQQLLPREIGAAAGWETIRLWQSHSSVYRSPLSGETEREREAIIGLAIAEAARLWQYVGRPLDKYGRREASEVAAATASRIFLQMYAYDTPYDSYRGGRLGSLSDRYSDDGDYNAYPSGHHRRRGSFSNYSGTGSVSPYAGIAAPIPVPSSAGSAYGGYDNYGNYGSYGGLSTSPYQYGGGYGGGYPTSPVNAYGYGQTLQPLAQPGSVIIRSNSSTGHRHHHHHHHRSHSKHRHSRSRSGSRSSYVATPYASSAYL